jgi:hypothetical protein
MGMSDDKRVFILAHPEARRRAMSAVADAPPGFKVTVQPPGRSLDQNALMWAELGEISERVDWHGQKLTPAEWKAVFTAALKRQKVVPGIDGGFVVLGTSTSRMSKSEMSELIELMAAFKAERVTEEA